MEINSKLVVFALVFVAGIGNVQALTKPTSIKLIDNAYTGIVVAIHRDVPENQKLITIIQDMFIKGSLYLYNATKQRAYFDEVTILIPQTWSSKPEYQQASNQSFDLADVIVAPPNPRWAPDPYTKQYQGCGKEGVHIHFWDQFLLDPNAEDYYGPLGRVLVHEWGHYRWGLFDEYADPVGDPDNAYHFYYSPTSGLWEGVRCSYDFEGYPVMPDNTPCAGNPVDGYEKDCVYYTKGTETTGSIMYSRQYYDEIVDFCDNNPFDRPNLHNHEAPNKHNRLCDTRSAWEVMRETGDFKDENNPPREIDPATLIPEFVFVQHTETRVVLVLDTSGSMNDNDKFTKMITSAANYITNIVKEGSRIGIVEFEEDANILSYLVSVYSKEDRNLLLKDLPESASGATCIGCGLLNGLQVLESSGQNPAGGLILLLSDGEENEYPYIKDVQDSLVDAGVIVDTIAFTQAAEDDMYHLAVLTGGTPYYYSNGPGDNTLYDAFAATMERGEIDDHERRIQLLGKSVKFNAQQSQSDSVFLDPTVGKNTEFSFQWTLAGITATVTQPNGIVLDENYHGYSIDYTFKLITFKIQDKAENGSWSLTITNTHSSSQEEVFFTVTSYATDPNVEPILVTSELSGSQTDFANGEPLIAYAEVRQGFSPIINATVWAKVDRPGDIPVDIHLLDNGAGADVTKYDGVYSRYFTQFTTEGFYGIKITVVNDGSAIILGESPVSKAIPNIPPGEGSNPPKIGNRTITPPWNPPVEPTGELAPNFTRGISSGSSNVPAVPPDYVPGEDYLAPGRITDLRVSETSFENEAVTLSWSAPGDDLDSGTVQYYDIRRADTIPELQNDFLGAIPLNQSDMVKGNLSEPQEFGNIEQFVIKIPIKEGATTASYAFAIQSWDDANPPLSSDVSNAVQATLRKHIPTAAPPTSPPTPTVLPSTNSPTTTGVPDEDGLPKGLIAGIAIGGLMCIALVVCITICFCSCCKGSKFV